MKIVTVILTCALFVVAAYPQGGGVDYRSLLFDAAGGMPQTAGEKARTASDGFAAASNEKLGAARMHYFEYQAASKGELDARAKALLSRRKQMNLGLEMDAALDEMRRGLFCAACRRTKSQVEADGENWQTHLDRNSQGRPVGATPQELAEKKREYEGKISAAKGEEFNWTQREQAAVKAKADSAQDVIASYVFWKEAMRVEDEGRAKAWDGAVDNYKERFDVYQKELNALDVAIARERQKELEPKELKVQRIADLESQKLDRQASLRAMVDEAERNYFERRMQESEFAERIRTGRSQLESFVSEVASSPLDAIASFTSLQTQSFNFIKGTPEEGLKLPGTPFTVGASPGKLDVTAGGPGLFKTSLRISDDWLRNKLHVDLVIGISTPMGLIEGGMRRTTEWGRDGTTIKDSPVYKLPAPTTPLSPIDEFLKTKKEGNKP